MFQRCGVFAEFERSIIRERINAGLARARENGNRLGRPRRDTEVEQAIRPVFRPLLLRRRNSLHHTHPHPQLLHNPPYPLVHVFWEMSE